MKSVVVDINAILTLFYSISYWYLYDRSQKVCWQQVEYEVTEHEARRSAVNVVVVSDVAD